MVSSKDRKEGNKIMMIQIQNTKSDTAIAIRDYILSIIKNPDDLDFDVKNALTFIETSYKSNIRSYIQYDYLENIHYLHIFDSTTTGESKNFPLSEIDAYWGE